MRGMSAPHVRRPRYPGRNPRRFQDKYKELNPGRYAAEVQKVVASGRTPAGMHRPIMVDEVLRALVPTPGNIAVDCTLGGGGHAQAILQRILPGGRLIGLDVDPIELPRTEARLRAAGFGADVFVTHRRNFAGLPQVLAAEGVPAADVILADLGVSSMQLDNPDRGFTYKGAGPLDMRMNPSHGEPASKLLGHLSEEKVCALLEENADEPHATIIAGVLKGRPLETTGELERVVRNGLIAAMPRVTEEDVAMSIRRTFQALRIAVNDEFGVLDALLRSLPLYLAPGGRVAFLTFHSGEDRRVKKSFQAGMREGVYAAENDEVERATAEERYANPRASSAKLRWAVRATALVLTLTFVRSAGAQPVQPHGHDLGSVEFPVSCSAAARTEFNRAVALLHHMTYPQAREAFQQVAKTDPRCAMAQWGIAMTLFQPLWPTRPSLEARQAGWDAVQKARALQPPTERERMFVMAAEAFFLEPSSPDYWLRIGRWEQVMAKVYAAFPDDPEAATFYAMAHLATTPSDTISRAHADRAAEILLRVYTRYPDHPGAMHYLVHANDVPGRERESLEITRKYDAVAPSNPHALHMPTHIYTRLGEWDAVIQGNLRAADAALEHPAGAHGEFVWDEFPHAIEYLVYAELQKGADQLAAAQLQRLHNTPRLEPTFKTAFHLVSTTTRDVLERHAWDEAASIVPRQPAGLEWDRFAWPEAIAQFARGMGAAHLGRLPDARAASARLEALEAATRKSGEELFARNIQMLRLELNAWLAHAEGRQRASLALMREAADLETSTPKHAVTPGPTIPAYELLGDLLMEQKQPGEARAAYKRSLELYPKRFNGLLGAARAARDQGDAATARTFYQALLEVATGGTRQPALKEARDYTAQGR
jgi:16S rRNA (cytosine(1402)-N(4))-methyltransferase